MDVGEITAGEVRTALGRMRTSRSLNGCRLLEMTALRFRLRAEGLSCTGDSLEWALCCLLHELVVARLGALRGSGTAISELDLDSEIALLAADFRVGSPALEAWSSLYYRFLCATVQLRARDLASIALPGRHRRSADRLFQRRVGRAVMELTTMVRTAERSAVARASELQRARPAVRLAAGRPARAEADRRRPLVHAPSAKTPIAAAPPGSPRSGASYLRSGSSSPSA